MSFLPLPVVHNNFRYSGLPTIIMFECKTKLYHSEPGYWILFIFSFCRICVYDHYRYVVYRHTRCSVFYVRYVSSSVLQLTQNSEPRHSVAERKWFLTPSVIPHSYKEKVNYHQFCLIPSKLAAHSQFNPLRAYSHITDRSRRCEHIESGSSGINRFVLEIRMDMECIKSWSQNNDVCAA